MFTSIDHTYPLHLVHRQEHHEELLHHQSTSRAHVKVLQNLILWLWCPCFKAPQIQIHLDLAGLLFPGAALQAETSSSGFRGLSQGRLQVALRGRNASQAARKEALALVRMLMTTSISALQQGLDTLSHLHYRPDAPSLITQVEPAPRSVSSATHQVIHTRFHSHIWTTLKNWKSFLRVDHAGIHPVFRRF